MHKITINSRNLTKKQGEDLLKFLFRYSKEVTWYARRRSVTDVDKLIEIIENYKKKENIIYHKKLNDFYRKMYNIQTSQYKKYIYENYTRESLLERIEELYVDAEEELAEITFRKLQEMFSMNTKREVLKKAEIESNKKYKKMITDNRLQWLSLYIPEEGDCVEIAKAKLDESVKEELLENAPIKWYFDFDGIDSNTELTFYDENINVIAVMATYEAEVLMLLTDEQNAEFLKLNIECKQGEN